MNFGKFEGKILLFLLRDLMVNVSEFKGEVCE